MHPQPLWSLHADSGDLYCTLMICQQCCGWGRKGGRAEEVQWKFANLFCSLSVYPPIPFLSNFPHLLWPLSFLLSLLPLSPSSYLILPLPFPLLLLHLPPTFLLPLLPFLHPPAPFPPPSLTFFLLLLATLEILTGHEA